MLGLLYYALCVCRMGPFGDFSPELRTFLWVQCQGSGQAVAVCGRTHTALQDPTLRCTQSTAGFACKNEP